MCTQEEFNSDLMTQMICIYNFRSFLSKLYHRNVTIDEATTIWCYSKMNEIYRDLHPFND